MPEKGFVLKGVMYFIGIKTAADNIMKIRIL